MAIVPKQITIIKKKILVGMQGQMQQQQYQNIVALWKKFMPQHRAIDHRLNKDYIALQDYNNKNSNDQLFDIWAAVEVSTAENIPKDMHTYSIPEGLYAIFLHKGMDAAATYQKIMTEWLPDSGYGIDYRPHFQIMGNNYKNGSDDSEEDFYIPVKPL